MDAFSILYLVPAVPVSVAVSSDELLVFSPTLWFRRSSYQLLLAIVFDKLILLPDFASLL